MVVGDSVVFYMVIRGSVKECLREGNGDELVMKGR